MPEHPVLSGAEIIKALEAIGFRQVRQRGSHVVLRRGEAGWVVRCIERLSAARLGAS
ncbi:MAG: type II toxin-antitoxin system HicA family toxin [Allosphingosinicella sp.]